MGARRGGGLRHGIGSPTRQSIIADGAVAGRAQRAISAWEGPGRRLPGRAPAWRSPGRSAGAPSRDRAPSPWAFRMDASTTAVRPRPGVAVDEDAVTARQVARPTSRSSWREAGRLARHAEVRDGVPAEVDPLPRERLEEAGRAPRHLPVLDEAQHQADPRAPARPGRPPPPRRPWAARPGSWAGRRPRDAPRRGRTGWTSWSGWPTGGVTTGVHQREYNSRVHGPRREGSRRPGGPARRPSLSEAREPTVMRYTEADRDDQLESRRGPEEDAR